MTQTVLFHHPFQYASKVDIGAKRASNQDEVICCPEYGFFAVSDGMGGLYGGGETSAMIAKVLPGLIGQAYERLKKNIYHEHAAELLKEQVCLISDNIYKKMNRGDNFTYGATLCGVWLTGSYAVFVNMGDSRGYWLGFYEKHIRQITNDHNVAAELVASGELSREEARHHSSSAMLTRFVGMNSPALPDTFIQELKTGDRILLCSDGLHGMLDDEHLARLMMSGSKNPDVIVNRLIDEANRAGGKDNISAVYIKVLP